MKFFLLKRSADVIADVSTPEVECPRALRGIGQLLPARRVALQFKRAHTLAGEARPPVLQGGPSWQQGFIFRPDRPNRRGPVPVYRSG